MIFNHPWGYITELARCHLWNYWIHSWCIDSEPCSSLVLSQIPFRLSLRDLFQHIRFLFDPSVWKVKSVWICIHVWNSDWYSRAFARFNPHWALYAQAQFFWVIGLSLSSLPQHFSTTRVGKGGFAVSFYVRLWNATSAIAEVPTVAGFASCCVGRACSWHSRLGPVSLCLKSSTSVMWLARPTASLSGSDN